MSQQGKELNWIEYLKTVDTPTLSNAIELLKIRSHSEGFTPLQVRDLFPEFGRMCGYAVTAQVETVTPSDAMQNTCFPELCQTVEKAQKPVVVALQEIGGHGDYAAHCGEVMATLFKRLGAIGLVTDCAVRDVPEVRALGFHYFARGTVASHASFRVVRVGVPIQVCGVVIRPGDLLHGDENGLLSVPAGVEKELQHAIESIRAGERRLLEWVCSDSFSLDRLRDFLVDYGGKANK